MNTDLLFESIDPIVSINSDEKDFFHSILNSITVLKKEYIFKEREVSDKIYYASAESYHSERQDLTSLIYNFV